MRSYFVNHYKYCRSNSFNWSLTQKVSVSQFPHMFPSQYTWKPISAQFWSYCYHRQSDLLLESTYFGHLSIMAMQVTLDISMQEHFMRCQIWWSWRPSDRGPGKWTWRWGPITSPSKSHNLMLHDFSRGVMPKVPLSGQPTDSNRMITAVNNTSSSDELKQLLAWYLSCL